MTQHLIDYLKKEKVYIENADRLAEFLARVEIIEEYDTFFSDKIRILKYGENYLVQEQTPRNELAVRLTSSLETAKQFIVRRLQTYENMWNGCGCRVDYYS